MKRHCYFLTFVMLTMTTMVMAQNPYKMIIQKTNGQTIEIATDEVVEVTFERYTDEEMAKRQALQHYQSLAGNWQMQGQDWDGIISRTWQVTLPQENSADYGKFLYVHVPAMLQGSKNYDIDFRLRFTCDAEGNNGTANIVVDDAKVGVFDADRNIFLRLDNMPLSSEYIAGEYKLEWSAEDGRIKEIKRTDRSQTLYFMVCTGDSYQEPAVGQLNLLGEVRLTRE